MAAAAAPVPVRELDDVTECPICAEGLTNARVLPCIHTFCLKCLKTYVGNAIPGEKKVCPLCRQHFAVPVGGLKKLPRNDFVEKVLKVKAMATRLSLSNEVACDVCKEEKTNKRAVVFCTDCNHNMCNECTKYHQKSKANTSHKLVSLDLDERHTAEELLQKLPEDHCHVHIQEPLELYCFECQVAICRRCYVKRHNSHKCSYVKTAARELNSHMQTDIDSLGNKEVEWAKMLAKITADEESFEVCASECERYINRRADHFKNMADNYRAELMKKVAIAKRSQIHQTKVMKDEIERQSVVLKNFIKYMNELHKKGTECDIAKLANSLHTRASELCKLDVEKDLAIQYSTTDVNFVATANDQEIQRIFGQLDIEVSKGGDFLASAKLLYALSVPTCSVLGVSSIDNQIFVLYSNAGDRPMLLQIYAYNASTLYIEGHFQISNQSYEPYRCKLELYSGNLWQNTHALAACSHNKCLYISDKNNCLVHNVPVSSVMTTDLPVGLTAPSRAYPEYDEGTGGYGFGSLRPIYSHRSFFQAIESLRVRAQKQHSQWSVELPPNGLSVNSAHNVLIACGENPVFLEYTTNGSLVRRVTLQPHVQYSVEHVVQLSRGRYGIIGLYQGGTHDYRIVDDNGQVVNKYRYNVMPEIGVADSQTPFPPQGQMAVKSTPYAIAVLHPSKVLIADARSNVILVLTEDEKTLTAVWLAESVCGKPKLSQPNCIHYDASKGRLYVGEYGTGRILCCGS